MIKVNNKTINYEKALLSVMYDNSLNPTGLGSVGIFFAIDDIEVYVGLKKDVIDVISNINTHTFINIPKNLLGDSKYGEDDYEFNEQTSIKVHLDTIVIDIDVPALHKSIYSVDAAEYADLVKYSLFKDKKGYGGVLHYYSILNIESGLIDVGLLVTKDNNKLVWNKNIINPDVLKDDVRYSIWWLKQNITPNVLSTHSEVKGYEKLLTPVDPKHIQFEYFRYFNDNYEFNTIDQGSSQFIEELDKEWFRAFRPHGVTDDKGDIFKINGRTRGNGVEKLRNNTNFGLKESRKAYFDLRKGQAWSNVGYEAGDIKWGDNFYVDTRKLQYYPTLTKIQRPTLNLDIPFLTKALAAMGKYIPPFMLTMSEAEIRNYVNGAILSKRPLLLQEARDALSQTLLNTFFTQPDYEYIKYKLESTTWFSGSISFLHRYKPGMDLTNHTVFAVHPFYNYAAYISVESNAEIAVDSNNNLSFTFPNGMEFGFNEDKFLWKSIEKEFRLDKVEKGFGGETIYTDLTPKMSMPDFEASDNVLETYKSWYNSINRFATIYVVDNNILKQNMMVYGGVSNQDYLFGSKTGFITI